MQFHITTDYAIRIISYLYTNQEHLSTAKDMSEVLGITYKYFMKVINRLKQAGMVQSIQGCNGGYYLTSQAQSVSIYDIIVAMEGEIKINRCLEEDCYCSRNATKDCPFRKMFATIQGDLVELLKQKKISDYV